MNETALLWDGVYRPGQWMFLFYSYSILGWVWESIYMSILERGLVNRGFLYGPCIPLYGAGATTVLLFTMPVRAHWWAVALLGMLVATILEELTGRIMESIFDVRYWTYEGYPGNIDGIICIPATLLWGVFSVLAMYVLNQPFEALLYRIPVPYVFRFVHVCTLLFVIDVTISVKNALDFKEVMGRLTAGRDELLRLKKRLDVMIAFYDDKHQYVSRLRESLGNGKDALSDALDSVRVRLEIMREIAREKPEQEKTQEALRELPQLQDQFEEQRTTVKLYSIPFKKYIRHLLMTNPKAKIQSVGASLKELAGNVRSWLPGKDGNDEKNGKDPE